MATLIKSNNVVINDYKSETLEDLQKAVGGYIQVIHTSKNVILVNEEGHMLSMPLNVTVSGMVGTTIVGDCLVMTKKEWNKRNK